MKDNEILRKVVETSDFVKISGQYTRLCKKGEGEEIEWVGRCPIHGGVEMTFSVEPRKSICGCSVCGRAWGLIDFVKEMEHTDYGGAIELLAVRQGEDFTSSSDVDLKDKMYAANEQASRFFNQHLLTTDDGRAIGLAYFRYRGISDEMINRFCLGYSPENNRAAYDYLISKGIESSVLTETGISGKNDRGEYYDRFRGRVIYPVHTVSGRVVAFGARTLKNDKDVAKYVNSPESAIYSKSQELYGLFQARDAIVEKGYAILVEGYMDVISMHQAGVCNVVASSGTSLTVGQVQLLRRFTDKVVVIYDADAAGIKAAVRSIDMLLSADMEMMTVTLPSGEDPDSFAKNHTHDEIERYLAENVRNMVDFRLSLLPERVMRDPVERTRAISQIIDSIALIGNDNRRRQLIATIRNNSELRLSEKAIVSQVSKRILEIASRRMESRRRNESARLYNMVESEDFNASESESARNAYLRRYEENVVKFAVRWGIMPIPDANNFTADGELMPLTAIELINTELNEDEMTFTNVDLKKAFDFVLGLFDDKDGLEHVYADYEQKAAAKRNEWMAEGLKKLEDSTHDLSKLEPMERKLTEEVDLMATSYYNELCSLYVGFEMLLSDDDSLRRIAADSLYSSQKLSHIFSRTATVEREDEALVDKIMLQIYCLKYATVLWQIKETNEAIRRAGTDYEAIENYMIECRRLGDIKKLLARTVGDRVIAPSI